MRDTEGKPPAIGTGAYPERVRLLMNKVAIEREKTPIKQQKACTGQTGSQNLLKRRSTARKYEVNVLKIDGPQSMSIFGGRRGRCNEEGKDLRKGGESYRNNLLTEVQNGGL